MADNTPRRIKELQEELGELNGDSLTAEQSRKIVRKIGESQLDMWDYMGVVINKLDKVDEMYNAYRIGKWLIILLAGTEIIFILDSVLSHVFGS